MKKGQTKIIIILLILISFILIVIVFKPDSSYISGNVVYEETNLSFQENIEEEMDGGFVGIAGMCSVSQPFGCEEFVIETTGITIILRNGDVEDYKINSIDIAKCGKIYPNQKIIKGDSQIFNIPCSLRGNTLMKGNIEINYGEENYRVSIGILEGIVN